MNKDYSHLEVINKKTCNCEGGKGNKPGCSGKKDGSCKKVSASLAGDIMEQTLSEGKDIAIKGCNCNN